MTAADFVATYLSMLEHERRLSAHTLRGYTHELDELKKLANGRARPDGALPIVGQKAGKRDSQREQGRAGRVVAGGRDHQPPLGRRSSRSPRRSAMPA